MIIFFFKLRTIILKTSDATNLSNPLSPRVTSPALPVLPQQQVQLLPVITNPAQISQSSPVNSQSISSSNQSKELQEILLKLNALDYRHEFLKKELEKLRVNQRNDSRIRFNT